MKSRERIEGLKEKLVTKEDVIRRQTREIETLSELRTRITVEAIDTLKHAKVLWGIHKGLSERLEVSDKYGKEYISVNKVWARRARDSLLGMSRGLFAKHRRLTGEEDDGKKKG